MSLLRRYTISTNDMPRVKKLNMKMSRAREYLGCSAERSAVHIRLMVSRDSARLRVTVCLTVRWEKGLGNEAGMNRFFTERL